MRNPNTLLIKTCSMMVLTLAGASWARAQTSTITNYKPGDVRADAVSPARFNFSLRSRAFSLSRTGSSRENTGPRPIKTSMLLMAGGPNLPVFGGGTIGRLTKWVGFTSNSFIGDSTIFEDKFGKVGIGTDAPSSRLTVVGTIETTLGGLKFPDGSVQTTAAVTGLQSVVHDDTLNGDGTNGAPLQVAVPLTLTGTIADSAIITVTNNDNFAAGFGIRANGGSSPDAFAGSGVQGNGGPSDSSKGGNGLEGFGGSTKTNIGGIGVRAGGGPADSGFAGSGVDASGGPGLGAGSLSGDGIVAAPGVTLHGAASGRAGTFNGDVQINGDLDVSGTKNFKIDHPLDPEKKYLLHAAIESSEVLNIYSGNVTTDGRGEATVTLPNWFEAINRDFRYQLTVIGAFAQAIVATEISQNTFTVRTSAPNVKVSWQVTGVRSDRVMLTHPFKAEEEKPQFERGTYVSPGAYGLPEDRGAEWARRHEPVQQPKQTVRR